MKNPKRSERFLSEIDALKKLKHPGIIEIIDHVIPDQEASKANPYFIVMPRAIGGTLTKRVNRYKGDIVATATLGLHLAHTLSAVHAAGIIHRDVKPDNILFASDDSQIPLLSDFGICLIEGAARVTDVGEAAGPRNYIAPEVEHLGPQDLKPDADIYSLGKVLYFAISGGIVFPRENLDEDRYRVHLQGDNRFVLFEHLLKKMVCQQDTRITNLDDIIEGLERIISSDVLAVTDTILLQIKLFQTHISNGLHAKKKIGSKNIFIREIVNYIKASLKSYVNTLNGLGEARASLYILDRENYTGFRAVEIVSEAACELRIKYKEDIFSIIFSITTKKNTSKKNNQGDYFELIPIITNRRSSKLRGNIHGAYGIHPEKAAKVSLHNGHRYKKIMKNPPPSKLCLGFCTESMEKQYKELEKFLKEIMEKFSIIINNGMKL